MMRIKLRQYFTGWWFILHLFFAFSSFGQNNGSNKSHSISIQSGIAVNSYNNLSTSLGFEYQKMVKGNWSYGCLYVSNRSVSEFASDTKTTKLNQHHLSFNVYYRLSLIKEKVFWDFGVGAGVSHVYFGENLDDFGTELNLSSTLNIKLFKQIYLQTSPLVVLIPSHRVYFSNIALSGRDHLKAFSFFPLGVKIAL